MSAAVRATADAGHDDLPAQLRSLLQRWERRQRDNKEAAPGLELAAADLRHFLRRTDAVPTPVNDIATAPQRRKREPTTRTD